MNVSIWGGLPLTCLSSVGPAVHVAVWKLGFICIICQQCYAPLFFIYLYLYVCVELLLAN